MMSNHLRITLSPEEFTELVLFIHGEKPTKLSKELVCINVAGKQLLFNCDWISQGIYIGDTGEMKELEL